MLQQILTTDIKRDVSPLVWRRAGLMVSALVSGSSDPGSSPGRGHCVVFLGKTLLSRCLSSPRCINGTGEFNVVGKRKIAIGHKLFSKTPILSR